MLIRAVQQVEVQCDMQAAVLFVLASVVLGAGILLTDFIRKLQMVGLHVITGPDAELHTSLDNCIHNVNQR